jgi:hypothetical protein
VYFVQIWVFMDHTMTRKLSVFVRFRALQVNLKGGGARNSLAITKRAAGRGIVLEVIWKNGGARRASCAGGI